MSGKIVHALPLTVYDFGSIKNGLSYTFTAGRVIDVSEYREAILVVRVHSQFFASANPTWQVSAYLSGFTAEDEKAQFTGALVADTGAQTPGPSPPAVLVAPFSVPFGPEVIVKVTLTQGGGYTTGTIALSVDIVAKC